MDPGVAGAEFAAPVKPILPSDAPPSPQPNPPPQPPQAQSVAAHQTTPEEELGDLVDLATADDDVRPDSNDPSNSATGALKIALAEQGVDSGQQVMKLLEQIENQLQQLQQLRAERNAFMADLDKRNLELDDREQRIQEVETEARENHRIVDQLKAQADQDTETLKREKSALESSRQLLEAQRKTIDAHQQAVHEQRAKLEAEAEALTEAQAKLDEERAQAPDPAQTAEQVRQLEAQLAEARQALEQAQTELAQAKTHASSADQLKQAVDAARAEIEKRDQAIELLTEQLDEATKPGAEAAPVSSGPDAIATLRRDRLKRVRAALNDRARKVHMAADQLRERKREIDQKAAALSAAGGPMSGVGETQKTLRAERQQLVDYAEALKTERNKLVDLKDQVERKARRAESRAAMHRASTMLFAIMGSLAIVAAGSWVAAQRFAEATFLAEVTVEADPAAGDDTTANLTAWTEAHQAMLSDPQFHEKAADRLRSRGIRELTSPSAVANYIEQTMTIEVGKPGQIRLTTTGVGAPRTERVLECMAAAVAAHGNSLRDFRADGLPTIVASAAEVDPTPVEDPRLQLFGIIFGAASGVLLFGGLVLWRRIAADQQAFEEKIKLSEGDFTDVMPPPSLPSMQVERPNP